MSGGVIGQSQAPVISAGVISTGVINAPVQGEPAPPYEPVEISYAGDTISYPTDTISY